MVDIQQPHFMPHATISDNFSNFPLTPWPAAKKNMNAERMLPPPSLSLDLPKYTYTFPSGQLTPPKTTEMNTSSPYRPAYRGALSSQTASFPPYSKQSASTALRSPPTSLSALVLPDPPERRQSPTNSSSSIAPDLQLPPTIHAPQTTLPQLAAEITCLFWFENGNTLKQIETLSSPLPALGADTNPPIGFRKWVATLLTTTQVKPNVVLLALLFIYKLKSFNPGVKGKPGSEYRLLTVALMLGNKFLDDNTYTNKTWAEVSGISVQEVHIMEVEFLSNMRYSLYTSDRSWREWQVKLGKFGTFINRAIRSWDSTPRPPPLNGTPTHVPGALPSPPVSNSASPPYLLGYSPLHIPRSNTPILLPQISSTAVSPIGPLPELDHRFSRKRSHDESGQEPPSKRHAPYTNSLPHLASTQLLTPKSHAHTPPRLPLPSLSLSNVSQGQPMQLPPQLPIPGSRSMSMVYPPPVQWPQQTSAPISIPPLQTTGLPPPNLLHLDQSRQLSPYPGHSAASSPVSATFTPVTQQSRLSPSYFLAQRSSPYRPVRQVHTLLAPPASSSMQNAPKLVAHDQMQYHPLGRPMNERRIGQLPYIHHDAWQEPHQFNQWPELPPIPQPVFH